MMINIFAVSAGEKLITIKKLWEKLESLRFIVCKPHSLIHSKNLHFREHFSESYWLVLNLDLFFVCADTIFHPLVTRFYYLIVSSFIIIISR